MPPPMPPPPMPPPMRGAEDDGVVAARWDVPAGLASASRARPGDGVDDEAPPVSRVGDGCNGVHANNDRHMLLGLGGLEGPHQPAPSTRHDDGLERLAGFGDGLEEGAPVASLNGVSKGHQVPPEPVRERDGRHDGLKGRGEGTDVHAVVRMVFRPSSCARRG